jgi:sugar O-acyltransferase (sialic acid O-acetyltransferase NeuD family)
MEEDRVRGEINDVSIFAHYQEEDARTVLKDEKMQYFVAEPEIDRRKEAQEFLGNLTQRPSSNIVHGNAFVSPYASLGNGNLIHAGCVVDSNAVIGDNGFYHANVTVGTDTRIGNFCTFLPGVNIGANAKVGDEVFVGTGATIFPGVTIGKGAIILGGSVVMRPVEAGSTVFGNPAKEID